MKITMLGTGNALVTECYNTCFVLEDEGQYFMAHQGRLSPHNQMMDIHLRQVFFTSDGWPVVSPERYTGSASRKFSAADIVGEWEIIRVQEPAYERQLQAGVLLSGAAGSLGKYGDRAHGRSGSVQHSQSFFSACHLNKGDQNRKK